MFGRFIGRSARVAWRFVVIAGFMLVTYDSQAGMRFQDGEAHNTTVAGLLNQIGVGSATSLQGSSSCKTATVSVAQGAEGAGPRRDENPTPNVSAEIARLWTLDMPPGLLFKAQAGWLRCNGMFCQLQGGGWRCCLPDAHGQPSNICFNVPQKPC